MGPQVQAHNQLRAAILPISKKAKCVRHAVVTATEIDSAITLTSSSAYLRACKRHRAIKDFRDAKIAQDQPAVAQQENVLALDVAVQHFSRVHVVDTQSNLHKSAHAHTNGYIQTHTRRSTNFFVNYFVNLHECNHTQASERGAQSDKHNTMAEAINANLYKPMHDLIFLE